MKIKVHSKSIFIWASAKLYKQINNRHFTYYKLEKEKNIPSGEVWIFNVI